MSKKPSKILMVYIEPTPYIIDLLATLIKFIACQIDIVFITENASQNWHINSSVKYIVLPKNKARKFADILKILSKSNYRLIHVAGWRESIIWLCIFWAKISRIPITIETDSQQIHLQPLWKRVIKRLLYPLLFKQINLFLAAGTRQVEYLKRYGVPARSTKLVQMTVDIAAIRSQVASLGVTDKIAIRQKYRIAVNDTVFIFVGRLEKFKGILDLILAFNNCSLQNISLVIVGEGSLTNLIQTSANRHENIHYLGRLQGPDLIAAYFAADVLVLPSHYESWGLVVNEAMAVGLAVIVSERVGCIDDLVDHNATGLITKSQDTVALQDSLLQLSDFPQHRALMGRNAVQKISSWTIEKLALNIKQAWSQLISI